MKFVFEGPAEQEFDEIVRFLHLRSASALTTFLDDVEAAKRLLEQHPFAGQSVGRQVRRLLLASHPYQLVYAVETETIRIYAVAHLKRRPRYWRGRLRR